MKYTFFYCLYIKSEKNKTYEGIHFKQYDNHIDFVPYIMMNELKE